MKGYIMFVVGEYASLIALPQILIAWFNGCSIHEVWTEQPAANVMTTMLFIYVVVFAFVTTFALLVAWLCREKREKN